MSWLGVCLAWLDWLGVCLAPAHSAASQLRSIDCILLLLLAQLHTSDNHAVFLHAGGWAMVTLVKVDAGGGGDGVRRLSQFCHNCIFFSSIQ